MASPVLRILAFKRSQSFNHRMAVPALGGSDTITCFNLTSGFLEGPAEALYGLRKFRSFN